MHLDADTLAAFAEHALGVDDAVATFAHLSECAACRDALAVHADLKDFRWSGRSPRRHRLIAVAAGIGCAAAALCLFVSSPSSRVSSKPVERSSNAARLTMPPTISSGWDTLSPQLLTTQDLLAARNARRFIKEVTLTKVSFEGASRNGNGNRGLIAVNQIVLKTKFGERRIAVEWGRSPTGLPPRL